MLIFETWKRGLIWATVALGVVLSAPNLFYTQVERHNDAAAALAEGQSGADLDADLAGWPDYLPSGLVNLGLDLRGGAQLLAEVQLQDSYAARMESYWPVVRDALLPERATVGGIRLVSTSPPDELHVRLANPEAMPQAIDIVRGLATPIVSLTSVGGTDIEVSSRDDLLIVTLSEAERLAMDQRTMAQVLEIVRRRIDEVGTREPSIQRQGSDRVLIQVPGIGSAEELKTIIGTTAQLTFQPVVRIASDANATAGPGNEVLPGADGDDAFYVLERAPVVTGEDLVDAQPAFDQNGQPSVTFRFNPAGGRKFGDFTAENIGRPFAIVLDDEVISAPVIQAHISGGSGQITGNFDVAESTNLAVLLRAGALPAELVFLEERTIGPELGQDSIDAGRIAALVAFAAVLVFMALSYGLFGIFANIALILNIALLFGALSLIGATLTLPGIAGIVLTVGMAVDANVLVFERIREELRAAKGPARAIERGYERALSAIIDANITTFITAVILFAMGSGPVRGFAITLGLGILTSVFTAIFLTRLLIVTWFDRRRPKTIEV
ncbi:MAG: protein translocase subunit SecD [Pseudoprimorskyibacter sp.]|nr:protein translocase subunit SecD [Pseudoprimorskyibacter sp.]